MAQLNALKSHARSLYSFCPAKSVRPVNRFWQKPVCEHAALRVSLQDLPVLLLCPRNLGPYTHIQSTLLMRGQK